MKILNTLVYLVEHNNAKYVRSDGRWYSLNAYDDIGSTYDKILERKFIEQNEKDFDNDRYA